MQSSSKYKKILFCVAPVIALWRKYPYIEPPFGSSLVVSGLRKNDFNVDYLDLNLQVNHWQNDTPLLSAETLQYLENYKLIPSHFDALPKDLSKLLDTILSFLVNYHFDCVAFSLNRVTIDYRVFGVSYGFIMILSHILKKTFGCKVILGGQILSIIGINNILEGANNSQEKHCDYFFFGDGSIALPKLLQSLNDTGLHNDDITSHLNRTKDSVFHWTDSGSIIDIHQDNSTTPEKPYKIEKDLVGMAPSFKIANSDLYPVTFKEIFPFAEDGIWVDKPIFILPYKFMYGCSHKCAFCKSVYEDLITVPAEVVACNLEKYVREDGARHFRFFNSQINFSQNYAHKLCKEIIKRNLNIIFSDSASLRNLSRDTCALLREAGCVKLWFGLESPNDRILKLINKDMTVSEAEKNIINAHEAGIWIGINIIVGFPNESKEEFDNLCKFIERHRDIVNCWSFSSLEVHEKTPLFKDPLRYGIRIHHKYTSEDNLYGYAFSEIGGLNWKNRKKQAEERVDICYDMVHPSVHRFYSNDYLVFVLYRKYKDKKRVIDKLNKYIRQIKHFSNLSDSAKWISFKDLKLDYRQFLCSNLTKLEDR